VDDYPKDRARRLRRNETGTEAFAWQVLREFRAHGFPVRRQHPINGIIVDFAIERAKLVIEIDGGIHDWDVVAEADRLREVKLNALGWRILRFSNQQAMDADLLFSEVSRELGLD
tara:strand:- start:12607 stop:12951 length:345 start_codon:yes stop_codon:yes gene_type:complete